MQVRDGDDVDAIGLYRIQKLLGETAQHNATDVATFDWRRQGRVTQARQRPRARHVAVRNSFRRPQTPIWPQAGTPRASEISDHIMCGNSLDRTRAKGCETALGLLNPDAIKQVMRNRVHQLETLGRRKLQGRVDHCRRAHVGVDHRVDRQLVHLRLRAQLRNRPAARSRVSPARNSAISSSECHFTCVLPRNAVFWTVLPPIRPHQRGDEMPTLRSQAARMADQSTKPPMSKEANATSGRWRRARGTAC